MKKNSTFIIQKPIEIRLLKPASDLIKYLSRDVQKSVYRYIRESADYIFDNFNDFENGKCFEYKTLIEGGNLYYEYVAFWDRRENKNFVVIITHGFCRIEDIITPESGWEMIRLLQNNYFSSIVEN